MRLLQSILARLPMTKPQRTFLAHCFGLVLLRPGRITIRHLSRYSPYVDQTPPAAPAANADATRIDFSVDHLARIVTQTLVPPVFRALQCGRLSGLTPCTSPRGRCRPEGLFERA